MTGPVAAYLDGGTRLHLQHGPIDLIIGVDGARQAGFDAAIARFGSILDELVAELPVLRKGVLETTQVSGAVARRMVAACRPFAGDRFVSPMAAVAGAVADEVLAAILAASSPTRAYVNNGGDIAVFLARGERFRMAMSDHARGRLGTIRLAADDGIGGIATSGRHGRSLSFGIADSVTVLATSAATADVAATLVANAVDLPGHPGVHRKPASAVRDDSDLGDRLVVTACDRLPRESCEAALSGGLELASFYQSRHLIRDAALFLQGQACNTGSSRLSLIERDPAYA